MSRCLPAQTVGPFFHLCLTKDPTLGCMTRPGAKGEHIRVRFRLLDGDQAPVPDGMLEIWQADANGKYDHPDDPQQQSPDPAFCGFGRLATDEDGVAIFETVYPGRAAGDAPHLSVNVFARGLLDRLCTRVYFADHPALAEDPVLALVPEDRRETLLARRDPADPAQWNFEIHLQGAEETVFFDL
ncbi:MAG TPA: protocatechuate 3,4-dioxygenase subunit alpha [Bryobacteraceae bacterium]|nr:protocatechuate 3,4-dioxygenase subunit alpha [Bryobacteraceae bacterium]